MFRDPAKARDLPVSPPTGKSTRPPANVTQQVLLALLKQAKADRDAGLTAGEIGGILWQARKGRVCSVNGGGDYAAQMLLGRMRKAGLVRVHPRSITSGLCLEDLCRNEARCKRARTGRLLPSPVITPSYSWRVNCYNQVHAPIQARTAAPSKHPASHRSWSEASFRASRPAAAAAGVAVRGLSGLEARELRVLLRSPCGERRLCPVGQRGVAAGPCGMGRGRAARYRGVRARSGQSPLGAKGSPAVRNRGEITNDQLRELFARHCACRPLDLSQSCACASHSSACDTAILHDVHIALGLVRFNDIGRVQAIAAARKRCAQRYLAGQGEKP